MSSDQRVLVLKLSIKCRPQALVVVQDLLDHLEELADPDGELRPEVAERLRNVSLGARNVSLGASAVFQRVVDLSRMSDQEVADVRDKVLELSQPAGILADREELELKSPPTQTRCRCCNRRLTDGQSIAAGEGPLCREGLCRRKAHVP